MKKQSLEVHTDGGNYVEGDVSTGRDFIGRDKTSRKTIINISGHVIVAAIAVIVIGIVATRIVSPLQPSMPVATIEPSVADNDSVPTLVQEALQCPTPNTYAQTINFDERMVEIPGMDFGMGDDELTSSRPKHGVSVETFFIDQYEVTNQQYQKFVLSTGRTPPQSWTGTNYSFGHAYYPVTDVTWHDAVAYCAWVGKRLIREDEWELACQYASGRAHTFEDEQPDTVLANTSSLSCGAPITVGSFVDASSGQVADLLGNVNEWTHSEYLGYPYDCVDMALPKRTQRTSS